MKNKVLTFIIGVLIGAIITTGVFYFYTKNMNLNNNRQIPGMMMKENEIGRPERPNEFGGQKGLNPPEIPSNNRNTI